MSKEESTKHFDRDLDLSNAGRGVWLVRIKLFFLILLSIVDVIICVYR